jgi:CopG antitoxin of type II toxin-antitoxin system
MASARSKRAPAKRREALPQGFATLAEAGEFWDAHDSGDYEDSMTEVACEVDLERRTYLVALDGEVYERVSALARKRGISTETLLNLWIHEKAS